MNMESAFKSKEGLNTGLHLSQLCKQITNTTLIAVTNNQALKMTKQKSTQTHYLGILENSLAIAVYTDRLLRCCAIHISIH